MFEGVDIIDEGLTTLAEHFKYQSSLKSLKLNFDE
jgi:hypothetical protein